MCAQYTVDGRASDFIELYRLTEESVTEAHQASDLHLHVVPHRPGPVVVMEAGHPREWREMNFSLVPSWSKAQKVPYATFNARKDGLTTKPAWKRPFSRQRCLVPMTRFIEPIYRGEYAGHMVAFYEKSRRILSAAGVWDRWVNAETGEVLESFAIITDEPSPFVREIGHDRMPLFLPPDAFEGWLAPAEQTGPDLLRFLDLHRANLSLAVEQERPMRPGWEKRRG